MKLAEIGRLRHLVLLENPGPIVPDGVGGFTHTWVPLQPSHVMAAIEPATARDLERTVANTVQSNASHLVTMRYHAGVNTSTRIRFDDRIFSVVGVRNLEERKKELQLVVTEIVT